MDMPLFRQTPDTGRAAQACMTMISRHAHAAGAAPDSPLEVLREIATQLEIDPHTARQVWVVRNTRQPIPAGSLASPWPLWFSPTARASERPLLYLTQSSTSAELCTLTAQAAERGIFCNDIESTPSRWPKGAHPWLPVWLASNHSCLPYDPACSAEARAILLGALQALYVDGQPGFCYLALHDQPVVGLAQQPDPAAAFQGMHQTLGFADDDPRPKIHLLGAGLMLREVTAAAAYLEQYCGVQSAVWSCPSYTRLAREAAAAEQWNRLHPGEARKAAHLHRCLPEDDVPIVAVTGYGQHIAQQIGAHLRAPFSALGADSPGSGEGLGHHWIAACALGELARLGHVPSALAEDALAQARRTH
jgi:pyruvate dehydrogenase E1 component